jgi:ABC-type oligopeptide transport system substrate-binding subunit
MFHFRNIHRPFLFGFTLALICCFLAGCGSDKGHRLSGKATFKGQPIAKGKIYFIPDTKAGNSGPTGFADITDGAYDTSSAGGRGIFGGPTIVRIEAVDPSQTDKTDKAGEVIMKQLFPTYETKADLPKSDSTKDFDVPADAKRGSQQKGGEIVP